MRHPLYHAATRATEAHSRALEQIQIQPSDNAQPFFLFPPHRPFLSLLLWGHCFLRWPMKVTQMGDITSNRLQACYVPVLLPVSWFPSADVCRMRNISKALPLPWTSTWRDIDYSHTFPILLHQLLLKEVIQMWVSAEGDIAFGVVYGLSPPLLMFTSASTLILNLLCFHFIIFYAKRCQNWRILRDILIYFPQRCFCCVFRCAG